VREFGKAFTTTHASSLEDLTREAYGMVKRILRNKKK